MPDKVLPYTINQNTGNPSTIPFKAKENEDGTFSISCCPVTPMIDVSEIVYKLDALILLQSATLQELKKLNKKSKK